MIYKTGINALDDILDGGLRPSTLVTVGGRPGMGKTSLLLSCATNLLEQEIGTTFFSLEFTKEYHVTILTRNLAGLPINKKNDELNGIEFQKLVHATNVLKNSQSLCSAERNFDKIKEEILNLPENIKIVFIDYLQLFIMPTGYEETSKAIIELKNLCHETNICIVVASQLSRNVENRQGHIPLLTDYRDSGVIEETADQCLMIMRRDYYDPLDCPNTAKIILAKNRFGNTKDCTVCFYKEFMKFNNNNPFKNENIHRNPFE
jgi:replicative DNA helicase